MLLVLVLVQYKGTYVLCGAYRWSVVGRSAEYEAVIEATCEVPGTRLRAPTPDMGLAPFCTDSFSGQLSIRVWRLDGGGTREPAPFIELTSSAGAASGPETP